MSLLFSTGAIAGSAAKGAPGMVLLTPTSVATSGGSASIGANGQVTFTGVTNVSMNGVFTADFDNYAISIQLLQNPAGELYARMRSAGSDASTSDYNAMNTQYDGTTVSAARNTGISLLVVGGGDTTLGNGHFIEIFGPYLAEPTVTRNVAVVGISGARVYQEAFSNHELSNSYDGITILSQPTGRVLTGTLQVYGVRS